MQTKDVLHISLKNIKTHFRRNLIIITVMGVIFGLVLTINLWFQGVENTYTELANQTTNGKIIIEATNSTEGIVISDAMPKMTRQEMTEDIEAYGGKVLGNTEKFGSFGSVILPEALVKNRIETDIEQAPVDAAPVLVSTFVGEQLLGKSFSTEHTDAIQKQKDYEEYRNNLIGKTFVDVYGAKYYVVGLSSGNFHVDNLSFKQLERGNNNVLNPILTFITTPEGAPIVIDNGKSESWQKGENTTSEDVVGLKAESDSLIAVFDDSKSAYNYLQHGKGRFMNIDLPNRTYLVNVVAGMSPETTYIIKHIKLIINMVSVVLGLIAAIVVIFTSIRLVDQDQHNIALYYSLGATTGQMRMIYSCYFLELMIGAAVLAFGLASGAVLMFSLLNQKLLSIQAMLGFNSIAHAQIIWYGPNIVTIIIMGIMLAMAPLCVLVNLRLLAPKNTTKHVTKHS